MGSTYIQKLFAVQLWRLLAVCMEKMSLSWIVLDSGERSALYNLDLEMDKNLLRSSTSDIRAQMTSARGSVTDGKHLSMER